MKHTVIHPWKIDSGSAWIHWSDKCWLFVELHWWLLVRYEQWRNLKDWSLHQTCLKKCVRFSFVCVCLVCRLCISSIEFLVYPPCFDCPSATICGNKEINEQWKRKSLRIRLRFMFAPYITIVAHRASLGHGYNDSRSSLNIHFKGLRILTTFIVHLLRQGSIVIDLGEHA